MPHLVTSLLNSVCLEAELVLQWISEKPKKMPTSTLNRLMTKPANWHVRPAKTQISLGIRPVWSESSLRAQWIGLKLSSCGQRRLDSDQLLSLRWAYMPVCWFCHDAAHLELPCWQIAEAVEAQFRLVLSSSEKTFSGLRQCKAQTGLPASWSTPLLFAYAIRFSHDVGDSVVSTVLLLW